MLSQEIFEARLGNITASNAHRIMAGWDVPKPDQYFPEPILEWIEKHNKKPLVGELKGKVKCDVTGKAIEAAWKLHQWNTIPQGLITYAEELACEELFYQDPAQFDGSNTPHMVEGVEREIEAVEALNEHSGIDLNFVKTGEDQIHINVDGIGATPDGIVYDDLDLIVTGCEIKCRTPLHHARQLFILSLIHISEPTRPY